MNLPDDYSVLFMQGGASLQFALIPMNLAGKERPVYINTGTWSTKAIAGARLQGLDPIVAASGAKSYPDAGGGLPHLACPCLALFF